MTPEAALDPIPLLGALQRAGVRHIVVGGFAVNAHGYLRTSADLDIVPDPEWTNLERLAALLLELEARPADGGDFARNEMPADPTDPRDLARGGNFRLTTRVGALDVMQWLAGVDAEDVYDELAAEAVSGEVAGVPVEVCGLRHLRAMKAAAGRPRDLDDLANLPEA